MAVSHRTLGFSLGLGALALCLPLGGCGDYSADPLPNGGGGSGATAGTTTTAGSPATGGGGSAAGGSSSGAPTTGGGGSGTGGGAGGRTQAPPAACEDVVACGGDAPGVWFATSSCLPVTGMADLTSYGIGCTMAPAAGKLEVTGNWTLGMDGKISDNTTTTGEVVMEMEPKCLNISGTVSTCDRLGVPLSSVGFSDLTCVDSTKTTGGCTCTGKIDQMGSMAKVSFSASKTGKFTAASNKLAITGDVREYDYCVSADIMTVTMKSKNDIGQVNGTVVFQKQP